MRSLTCRRSLYFSCIRCLRSSSSLRRNNFLISAASWCDFRSGELLSFPFDSGCSFLLYFLTSSSSSLKLSSRISESLVVSVRFWTTLMYSTLPFDNVIFFNIGCLHEHKKFFPKNISFCNLSAFCKKKNVSRRDYSVININDNMHSTYLCYFYVNITTTKYRFKCIILERSKAGKCYVLLKSNQLMICCIALPSSMTSRQSYVKQTGIERNKRWTIKNMKMCQRVQRQCYLRAVC